MQAAHSTSLAASADRTFRYSFAQVSLDGKSPRQVFVYVTASGWRGTGGCTAFLLEPRDDDIAMPVQGGGIINEHMAVLRFNGRAYPSNPSMAPKLGEKTAVLGMEIPPGARGALVY